MEQNAQERARRCFRLVGILPVTLEGWEDAGVALMDAVESLRYYKTIDAENIDRLMEEVERLRGEIARNDARDALYRDLET